jgi:hypothetical protein
MCEVKERNVYVSFRVGLPEIGSVLALGSNNVATAEDQQ